jgi:hypothetical protein
MEIDLRRYGILGNTNTPEPRAETSRPASTLVQPSKGLGGDLAKLFNVPPEKDSGTDFIVTALKDGDWEHSDILGSGIVQNDEQNPHQWLSPDASTSPPIYVHKLILQARWPHFARLYSAQMAEFHTKKMHIPEPYSVVKAFLYYLYTDSIHPEDCPELNDVAGLLVMSNIYNIPHLRLLCVNRLAKELDVEHACIIWLCAGVASEDWLRRRAASFCLLHWGRIVRTRGFLKLPRQAIVDLSQEIDMEGRVVGGEYRENFVADLQPQLYTTYVLTLLFRGGTRVRRRTWRISVRRWWLCSQGQYGQQSDADSRFRDGRQRGNGNDMSKIFTHSGRLENSVSARVDGRNWVGSISMGVRSGGAIMYSIYTLWIPKILSHTKELLCVPAEYTQTLFSSPFEAQSTVQVYYHVSYVFSRPGPGRLAHTPLMRLLTDIIPSPPQSPRRQFPQRRRRPVISDGGLPSRPCVSGMPLRRGDRVGLDAAALALPAAHSAVLQ